MTRLFVLLMFCCLSLTGCRYWVMYEFVEQFCTFEEYIGISMDDKLDSGQVKIQFHEPVLSRSILLRYLNAQAFQSLYTENLSTQMTMPSKDIYAIRRLHTEPGKLAEAFRFELTYHPLDKHALLESAYLDAKLSQLFSPALLEPMLRSLCSDDYDLSLKQLDMRFSLSSLSKPSLPSRQELISVFGETQDIIIGVKGEQTLRYEFDFLARSEQLVWKTQGKPISMRFSFDSQNQLKNLYIHYYKYSYWLDLESLSGRLLVIRHE